MEKAKKHAFNKDIYLLGIDNDGKRRWLEAASWDCDWYWGFGYIETYTYELCPERARDIDSHTHFDSLFFNQHTMCYDAFKDFFKETPLTDTEIWKLLELMKTFYICRQYSDMLSCGGANITTNPIKDDIRADAEYKRINKEVLPSLFKEVYALLTP